MMVIELTEDRFGKIMKDIACIADKLSEVKEVFEDEAMGQRRSKGYEYPDHDYGYGYRSRDYSRDDRKMSRYM